MDDLSGEVPIKRMSVAKGRLTGIGDATFDIGHVEAAAKLAVKQADAWIPDLHSVQASHIQVDVMAEDSAVVVTVTVQAHSRGTLDNHALAGVAAGLLAARTAAGADGVIDEMRLVQNVE